MDGNLERIRIIEADKLDSEHYFQSLLEQARTKGLLSDDDIERVQYECLELLAFKAERYNAGDSSSIRVEKAQDIMASNLFTISLWLKACPDPDDAVSILQRETIGEIYHKGCERIDAMLASAKAIHAELTAQLIYTKNVYYRSTVIGGINGFFKLYSPDYSAHEIHITADYPAFNPMPRLDGIEFIHSYLECLNYENQFCGNFAAGAIHHLLCGYLRDYGEHLINIYEPVLLAAIGCIIEGTDVFRLDITESGAAHLRRLLAGMRQGEISALVCNAVTELTRVLACKQELARYVHSSIPMIVSRIKVAAQLQTLDHVFVLPAGK